MIRRLAIIFAVLVLFLSASLAIAAIAPLAGERQTPSGMTRNSAITIGMRDGSEIAVDIWLPPSFEAGNRVKSLFRATRYWRAVEPGPIGRLMMHLGWDLSEIPSDVAFFNRQNYAVILVDARGTGASSGVRRAEWSPQEAADYYQVLDWIIQQPWSNGRVGAYGISYDANTAEMLAGQGHPALRGVVSISGDFDPWAGNVRPGGVYNRFADQWGKAVAALDSNDVCSAEGVQGIECWITKRIVKGIKPVDDDSGGTKLDRILAERTRVDVAKAVRHAEFRDDDIAPGLSLKATSPYGQIDRAGYRVPMQVWTGWFDAMTTDGAIARFMNLDSPQEVWVGPWSHGVRRNADPFQPVYAPDQPDEPTLHAQMLRFFDSTLGDSPKPRRQLALFVHGSNKWVRIADWDAQADAAKLEYFTNANGGLVDATGAGKQQTPSQIISTDINFSATTGEQTRWHTQNGGGDIIYNNQTAENPKRTIFESNPLSAKALILGAPVANLRLKSSAPDGAVHIYLEAVSSQGKVIYLSEGILRLKQRLTGSSASSNLPYKSPNFVMRSFARADAAPMRSGIFEDIVIPMAITAAEIPAGYRIRLAIAGADASLFQRYPARGQLRWEIATGGPEETRLSLPLATSPQFITPPWLSRASNKE